jgi:hypothetical protein
MISQKIIIYKKKKEFNTYKDKDKKAKIKNHFKINHNVHTYTKIMNQKKKNQKID